MTAYVILATGFWTLTSLAGCAFLGWLWCWLLQDAHWSATWRRRFATVAVAAFLVTLILGAVLLTQFHTELTANSRAHRHPLPKHWWTALKHWTF